MDIRNCGRCLRANVVGGRRHEDVVRGLLCLRWGRRRFNDGQLDMGALEYDPDTDSDTIPDRWELQYFSDLSAMTDSFDSDGDGFLDWQERIGGTDPTDAFSLLAITGVTVENGSDFVIKWSRGAGVRYTVGFATDLAETSFVRAMSGIPATPL